MKYFSPSVRGFFDRVKHGKAIPADAVEITDDEWRRLLKEHATGLQIVLGDDGRPTTRKPVPRPEIARANAVAARDHALSSTDWIVARHRDEVELGGATTLTGEQYKELQGYRAALRAASKQMGLPGCGLPPAPAFLGSGS